MYPNEQNHVIFNNDLSHLLCNHCRLSVVVTQVSKKSFFCCCLRLDEALAPYLGAAQEITEAEQQDMEIPLPVRKCPNCGRDMVLKKKREGNR